MAKDPAINWYFDNWSGGTKGFNRFQKGCYMDLLEAQFYLGHLSLDQIKNILGADFTQWNFLKSKFAQDEQENFFNERMEQEKEKRARFSKKQFENGSKGGRPKTQTEPKQNPNHNPTTNPNKTLYGTEIINKENGEIPEKRLEEMIVPEILRIWQENNPGYQPIKGVDYPACLNIAYNIADLKSWRQACVVGEKENECLRSWEKIAKFICTHTFWSTKTLDTIATPKNWQKIVNDMRTVQPSKPLQPQIWLK